MKERERRNEDIMIQRKRRNVATTTADAWNAKRKQSDEVQGSTRRTNEYAEQPTRALDTFGREAQNKKHAVPKQEEQGR